MTKGVSFPVSRSDAQGAGLPSPLLADAEQLKLRYDAGTKTYEIQMPSTSAWVAISGLDTGGWETADGTVTISATQGGNTAFVRWSAPNSFGITAVAIPTPLSAIPASGTGHYVGSLSGISSEKVSVYPFGEGPIFLANVFGTITLDFDFAAGTLGGFISPRIGSSRNNRSLPAISFSQTVYAAGSSTFSGKFNTSVPGMNGFSGLFAGPSADDVAGSFAFPYVSPFDHQSTQQASGAFTATKGP